MIEKLSIKIKEYTQSFSSLIIFLIIMVYIKLALYLSSYNAIFNPLDDKTFNLMSFFRFFIFSLSFISIILIFIFILGFFIFLIIKKLNLSYRKPIFIVTLLLEMLSFMYIYSDLQIYKIMGVHLHNDIVLGAINKKDLSNDVALSSDKVFSFLSFPFIVFIITLLFFFLLIYFKTRFNLDKLLKRITVFLSIPIFISLFLVVYFWINLFNELTAIPFWSYIEKSHISNSKSFESNYEDNFNYDNIKIKNKMNVIVIIAESFRTDVFNKENTPNMFNFINKEKGIINSKHHFSSAHFTLNSIFGLWYSIYGYHHEAIFNKSNYKQPIPIKVFNKLNYDTQFLTTSFLIPSSQKIKKATKTFKIYKTFKKDEQIINYFKKYYNSKEKDKLFLTMLFFKSSHYAYAFPDSHAKYKPFLSTSSKGLFEDSLDIKKNYEYKEKLFNRYKNSVLYIDFLFKKVINILSAEDKKNTIIIFIGDHGEEFWEHGYFGHTRTSYTKEVFEVPLIFYIPKLDKNFNIELSSHSDIMTTLLDYITDIKRSDIHKFFNGISLINTNDTKNHQFIISSFSFMGLKSKIALINKYGKLILESKTNKIKSKKLFNIIEFNDFDDKKITDKTKINYANPSFKKFRKNYLKFIK